MSGIEIRNLCKQWAAFAAVQDVSFEVLPGKLTVLLGPSGCGKSTTLRLIAGLEMATSGQIRIGGRDVTWLPPAQRGLSMVFQSYALFPHLTVAENITFGLDVRKVPKKEKKERLEYAAQILGLDALLHRRPSQLSGGQQQRVALGRAIVAKASVCLMDEPLSNLDAQLRHDMRAEIKSLQRSLGMTMVYVTHDQVEAMSLADEIILMRAGKIEQRAAPADLYSTPVSTFAARFIGTPAMSILSLADGAHGAVISGTQGPALFGGKGEGFLLGIRPEQIRDDPDGPIDAKVRSVDYHGADSILDCIIGDQTLQVRVEGVRRYGADEAIRLGWDPQAMHIFEAESERRVERAPLDFASGKKRPAARTARHN
ncbi:MAG: ABC transporter ATP-binding protein [Rhizobiaceae bacterium]|nr:ABC transporter ATP-binding protein [Rhizobiaceae bacterium]